MIPKIWNWRPYWGINPDVAILHFHGPKPLDSLVRINREYPESLRPVYYYEAKEEWLEIRGSIQ
jgi:hypothetical protein